MEGFYEFFGGFVEVSACFIGAVWSFGQGAFRSFSLPFLLGGVARKRMGEDSKAPTKFFDSQGISQDLMIFKRHLYNMVI